MLCLSAEHGGNNRSKSRGHAELDLANAAVRTRRLGSDSTTSRSAVVEAG